MDQYALFNHVSRGREVLEDGPQAFNTVHYVSRTAKSIALIGLGSLQISILRVVTRRTNALLRISLTKENNVH
jgi:hypothetical protein